VYFTLFSRHSLGIGTIKMLPFRSLRWGIKQVYKDYQDFSKALDLYEHTGMMGGLRFIDNRCIFIFFWMGRHGEMVKT